MKQSQKIQVWLTAMHAVHNAKYGVRLLVSNDLAISLRLKCLIADDGFELVRMHRKDDPCSRFTRIAFVTK